MLVPPSLAPKDNLSPSPTDSRCQTILFPYQSPYNCFNLGPWLSWSSFPLLTFASLSWQLYLSFFPFFPFNWLGHVSVDLSSLTRHRTHPLLRSACPPAPNIIILPGCRAWLLSHQVLPETHLGEIVKVRILNSILKLRKLRLGEVEQWQRRA